MWWWVCWHLYWDIGHIVGEFPYPDTSQWTDEELGIPPDDLDWIYFERIDHQKKNSQREREREGEMEKYQNYARAFVGNYLLRKHKQLQIQWRHLYLEYVVK